MFFKKKISKNKMEELQKKLTISLENFLGKIADHYNINYDQLQNVLTVDDNCWHTFLSGKNKGKRCIKKALSNGYCTTHQRSAVAMGKKTIKKEKGPTKTELQLLEIMSTAMPNVETELTPCEHGLVHEDTEIVFNENFQVIGRLTSKGKLQKLTPEDLDICEKYCWEFTRDGSDNGSDGSDGSDNDSDE